MPSAYRVLPLFLIRLAGVPFETVEKLATPRASARARELVNQSRRCNETKEAVEQFFRSREQLLQPEVYHELRLAVRSNRPPAVFLAEQPPVFSNYAAASIALRESNQTLQKQLEEEVHSARVSLLDSSRRYLPPYLLFGAEGVRNFLVEQLGSQDDGVPVRNNAARKVEQSLLLYLQRLAAKNDTFSEFGPSSWGTGVHEFRGVRIDPKPGIARREAFLERWTAHAVASAINADPETLAELRPRLNPNGVILGDQFVHLDTGEAIRLTPTQLALLAQCDGRKSVATLSSDTDVRALIAKKVIIAALEVPALDPFAFDQIREDVSVWRAGAVRDRWQPVVEALAGLPAKFSTSENTAERRAILSEARQQLNAFGAVRKPGQRSLYSAINPIGEECVRETNFAISEQTLQEISSEAAPWIDFWRDSYAFIASRVAAGLRMIFEKLPSKNGAIPLPAFLRGCEIAGLPLTGPGLVGLSAVAFQEIKAAFRARMQPYADRADYEITAADGHFVRENFHCEHFDEFTFPSADLQLAAPSAEAVGQGKYQWILSELHPPAALLHHAGYWSCPGKSQLNSAIASAAGNTFHFGFFAADFTSHTAVRVFDAMPQLTAFVAAQRAAPHWRRFPPSHTEVYLQENGGDVRLRHVSTHEDLGSFSRNWIIALGFHPFQFGMSPHMPRLRCGKVIVQRRAWTISADELASGDFSGLSRDLVVAVEKLRGEKNWPRFVYIRPTEQSLRRSGAEGRDKDTKPVFIDLESYLFLEIFHRWLAKAGELEVVEMLPAPDDLCWREADGRRTFELRTLIIPRT